MKIKLSENFVERIAETDDYEKIYAALWIISGIKHKVKRMNGAAVMRLSQNSDSTTHCIDIFKLGYVQALVDLGQPLKYKNKLPTSQEFLCRGFDALGINVLDKSTGAVIR
jgi:hypothetical protein